MKRFKVEREVTITRRYATYVFAETYDEGLARALERPFDETLSETTSEPCLMGMAQELPFEDSRHPKLIPFEGKRVLIKGLMNHYPDEPLWVTPSVERTNAVFGVLYHRLSKHRKGDRGGFGITPDRHPDIEVELAPEPPPKKARVKRNA